MDRKQLPHQVDTVIVGNGPSALILSFILNGNIPYYDTLNPHPDPILHQKLRNSPALLDVDVPDLSAHFAASRLSYSTQALPINVLLDTLLRPLADTNPSEYRSRVEWRHEHKRRVPHVALGNTVQAGGQWADNPVSASWDIGTLSYAEMLSLPGYTFEDYYYQSHGERLADFYRPTRRDVAHYLAAYPEMVGIGDSVYTDIEVGDISRTDEGFYVKSHNIRCRHLVLASGIFSNLIPPRPLLQLLADKLPSPSTNLAPVLVIGSGFTAADIIISTPADRKIIHIFKWDPDEHPSPLRACHPRAYPEYASVYRRMKLAAKKAYGPEDDLTPLRLKKTNPFFSQRDLVNSYEGLPNTFIKSVSVVGDQGLISLEDNSGHILERKISNMEYVIGRRGSLNYLDSNLATEVIGGSREIEVNASLVSGRTLRTKAEDNLECARNVFIVGSLTGDSLIRFAFGGCLFAAREIMQRFVTEKESALAEPDFGSTSSKTKFVPTSQVLNGGNEYLLTNGHTDLSTDKRTQAIPIDLELSKCELWQETSWWAGGCIIS